MTEPQPLDLSIEDWRNLVLIAAAFIGLPLATWRSWLAHKQTRLSEAGQNIDRYQKGAAMLGDQRMSVRQAGIFGLAELVEKDPLTYYAIVQELLCSFIRDRSDEQERGLPVDDTGTAAAPVEWTPDGDMQGEETTLPMIAADCQTAITKLSDMRKGQAEMQGRVSSDSLWFPRVKGPVQQRTFALPDAPLDLHNANLSGAILTVLQLEDAKNVSSEWIEHFSEPEKDIDDEHT